MLCSKLSKDVIIFNCKKDNFILFDDKIYFQWQWPSKEDWNSGIISLEIHHGITKSWRTYSWKTYVFCTVANISKEKGPCSSTNCICSHNNNCHHDNAFAVRTIATMTRDSWSAFSEQLRHFSEQNSGFDLTFQKCFVSFPNKNNSKLISNIAHHGWARKKNFHSRSPTVLNDISITFLSEQHQICALYYKTWRTKLNRKELNERLYTKSFENKFCGIRIHT